MVFPQRGPPATAVGSLRWSVGADAVDHDGRYQERKWDQRAADLVLELPASE